MSEERLSKVIRVISEWFKQWEIHEEFGGSLPYEMEKPKEDGEKMNKLLVVNGQFYSGVGKYFSTKRSDALSIKEAF